MRIPAFNWHVKEVIGECSAGAGANLMPEIVMEGECEPVQLEPFVHQVGGHSSMLLIDDTTLCKPLISREWRFYETLPRCLRKVTPQYRGVIEVSFQEDSAGYLSLVARPSELGRSPNTSPRHGSPRVRSPQSSSPLARSPRDSPARDTGSPEVGLSPNSSVDNLTTDSDSETAPPRTLSAQQRFRMQKSGSIEIEGLSAKLQASMESKRDKHVISYPGLNPWSLSCHKKQLAKMSKSSHEPHQFILLENLASQFSLPCILDLKMGPRQHGDDVSEDKKQRHIRRCKQTTSEKLGFRICGMQVYQADTGQFLCHNKYYGRRLDELGVRDTLTQFLQNGKRMRLSLIDTIVGKLQRLYDTLKQQNTFRFYSSSLLVMYDGLEENSEECFLPSTTHAGSSHRPDVVRPSGSSNGPSTSQTVEMMPIREHPQEEDFDSEGTSCVCPQVLDNSSISQDEAELNGVLSSESQLRSPVMTCQACLHNAGLNGTFEADSVGGGGSHLKNGVVATSDISTPTSGLDHPHSPPPAYCATQERVDVRMIDFAHATHSGFCDDETRHDGPDRGYLFGLRNLIQMFKQLKERCQSTSEDFPNG